MLGSIKTGGFTKSQVDAMQDSNYFQRQGVPNVYDPPNPKAKKDTGDFLDAFVKNKTIKIIPIILLIGLGDSG